MNAVLFVGPSFPHLHRIAVPGIEVRPPAAQGDLLRAVLAGVRTIGLVDGVFGREPAVWHKEILFALERGVRVLGAASMGALRAAELHPFGMEGIGTIFAAYRDGLLLADDEVALVHGPAELGWPALSEPMVNWRATLARLERHGLLGPDEAARIARMLAERFYPERTRATFGAVLHVVVGPERAETVARRAARLFVDAKRADAARLLRRMRHLVASRVDAAPSRTRVQRSAPFRALLRDTARGSAPPRSRVPLFPSRLPSRPLDPRVWAVFAHVAADNDLASEFVRDLEEASSARGLERVHLVGEADSRDPALRGRFAILPAGDGRSPRVLIEPRGPRDTGEPELLAEFLRWALPRFPAARRALLFWGHGEGSRLAIDDGAQDALSVSELVTALEAGLGPAAPVDLAVFDACLMATLEVASDLAPFARLVVASPEVVPASGLPYQKVVEALARRALPEDAASELISAFLDDAAARGQRHARLLLVRTEKAVHALEAVGRVGFRLRASLPRARPAIRAARLLARAPRSGEFVDAADLLDRLARVAEDRELELLARSAAQAVAGSVLEAGAVEPAARSSPTGPNLWFPAQLGAFRRGRAEYASRPAIRGPGAGWLAFLDAFHAENTCDRRHRAAETVVG
ncbi:MAG: TfuA-like protein [Geminicoccaceae bacterium]|nr:TfuA-like protein [Geminicoccaceae bacterium]